MQGKGTSGGAPGITPVLERNIRLLHERRQREEEAASLQDRVASIVTRFAGSMVFVYLHIAIFGAWIAANLGLIAGVPKWDPDFVMLAMTASIEAIILTAFVLISQNRMAEADAKRADLDLQISLLAEHEITKLASLLEAVAQKLGVPVELDRELQDVKQDVAPGQVMDHMEQVKPDAA